MNMIESDIKRITWILGSLFVIWFAMIFVTAMVGLPSIWEWTYFTPLTTTTIIISVPVNIIGLIAVYAFICHLNREVKLCAIVLFFLGQIVLLGFTLADEPGVVRNVVMAGATAWFVTSFMILVFLIKHWMTK